VVFRDSVQKALDEGKLNFGDKPNQPMQVDVDPLKKAYSMYLEIAGLNMVKISEIDPIVASDGPKVDVEMVIEGHKCVDTVITEDLYQEKIQVVFPKTEEDLIDFLNRCKISSSSVMLCPGCSTVFDKKAAKNVEGFQPRSNGKKNGLTKGLSSVSIKQTFMSSTHPQMQTGRRDQRKPSLLLLNPQITNGYFLVLKSLMRSLHLQCKRLSYNMYKLNEVKQFLYKI